MFLTVTPNASLDRILFIERFTPQGTMRTRKTLDAVGGKGFDISVALRGLDQETTALGFRAGRRGEAVEQMLAAYGVQTDLVEVEGETRIAHVLVEEALRRHSHITTRGYAVGAVQAEALLEKFRTHLPSCAWAAAGGSLPDGLGADFFQTLANTAHERRVPILLDISGEVALRALAARPEILKMNRAEFGKTFEVETEPFARLVEHAARIAAGNVQGSLVVTCGCEGILAFTPAGNFSARAPVLEEVNAAGAGDAASAALMCRLSLGGGWDEALRWAAAAGAATVLSEATAECDLQTVRALLPQVELVKM